MRIPRDLSDDDLPEPGEPFVADGLLWVGEGGLLALAGFMVLLGLLQNYTDFKDHMTNLHDHS
jgi:hypothetical protein